MPYCKVQPVVRLCRTRPVRPVRVSEVYGFAVYQHFIDPEFGE
jgi:hypothetical protein